MFTKDAETRNKIHNERNKLEPIKDTVIKWLIDKNHAVLKITKQLQKQGGIKETLGKEVQYGLEEANYIAAEIDNYVYSLGKDVLTPMNEAKLAADDIGTYLFLKRVQTERSEIANPLGHTTATAKETLSGLEKRMGKEKFAKLEKVVEKFRNIREEMVIPRMEETKMYSPDLLKTMKESKDYARFSVLNYLEKKYGRGETARVYKQIGTLSEISNPFVATVLQDISMLRAAKINEVKLATADMLKATGAIEPAEMYYSLDIKGRKPKVPPNPKQEIFSVMVDGKMQHYYIHKDIAKTFETNPYEATVIAKVWALINQPIRAVFVSQNPFWMVRNVIRDFRTTLKNLPHIKPRDTGKLLKAYKEAYKEAWAEVMKGERSEDITAMMKGYMLTSDRAYSSRDSTFENEIERLVEEFQLDVGADRRAKDALARLKRSHNYLDNLGRVSEIGGKVAGYKYLKKYTALPQREIGHIVRTRVGTPDYKRRGALHATTNNVFLFSNVNKEGTRSSYESFQDDKGAFVWKTIIFNILPKLLLLGAAAAGPPVLKKIIGGISEYDKRSYTIIPLGLNKNGKSVYLRIPEDYEGQIFGAIAWDIANGKLTGPGGALDVAGQMQPYQLHPLISVGIDLYQYYIQGINPLDEYRGRQIIPNTEFQAGGAAASKEMLRHTWEELGGTIIYNPGGPAQYADTTFEKLLQYPPLNILGAFLKVSDYGHQEKEYEQERKAQKTKARERLIRRQMEEALKKKDMERYHELRRKLTK